MPASCSVGKNKIMTKNIRIKNFPVSFFSVVMGLSGFTISLEKSIELLGINKNIPMFFLYLTTSIFIILCFFYAQKIIKYPAEVKKEFYHPIKINFFPTISISLLLLSVAFLANNLLIAKYLWLSGTLLHLFFSLKIISTWIQHRLLKIEHMNPAWFIPAVGNILIPISGIKFVIPEISWFFFSVGLFFWIILLVIFFNRIFFHHPLSDKLLPTLFILIAPPAVGFISYFKLSGEINDFSRLLFNFALFITLLLLVQINTFKKIKYYLSWWAYSFPLASMSIASALMYHENGLLAYKYIYIIILILLLVLISLLAINTLKLIKHQQICIEED